MTHDAKPVLTREHMHRLLALYTSKGTEIAELVRILRSTRSQKSAA